MKRGTNSQMEMMLKALKYEGCMLGLRRRVREESGHRDSGKAFSNTSKWRVWEELTEMNFVKISSVLMHIPQFSRHLIKNIKNNRYLSMAK